MNIVRKLWMFRRHNEPLTQCMVEIDIDIEQVAQRLGNSAWRNKTKKSRALNGAISVKVRETQASKEAEESATEDGR